MKEYDSPLYFLYYCVERWARTNNLTSKSTLILQGTNPYTSLIGEEGGISNICQYKWYDWCYYMEHKEFFPFNREVLGRFLGPETGAGNEMAQWILKSNGYIVNIRTLIPLHVDEIHTPEEQKKRKSFGALIERIWGTSVNPPPVSTTSNDEVWEEHEDEDESTRIIPNIEDMVDSKGRQLNQQPA